MQAALDRLPLAPWEIFLLAISGSVLTIFFAALIGRWVARSNKTPTQTAFGVCLALTLLALLYTLAVIRSSTIKDQAPTMPQVQIINEQEETTHA